MSLHILGPFKFQHCVITWRCTSHIYMKCQKGLLELIIIIYIAQIHFGGRNWRIYKYCNSLSQHVLSSSYWWGQQLQYDQWLAEPSGLWSCQLRREKPKIAPCSLEWLHIFTSTINSKISKKYSLTSYQAHRSEFVASDDVS